MQLTDAEWEKHIYQRFATTFTPEFKQAYDVRFAGRNHDVRPDFVLDLPVFATGSEKRLTTIRTNRMKGYASLMLQVNHQVIAGAPRPPLTEPEKAAYAELGEYLEAHGGGTLTIVKDFSYHDPVNGFDWHPGSCGWIKFYDRDAGKLQQAMLGMEFRDGEPPRIV